MKVLKRFVAQILLPFSVGLSDYKYTPPVPTVKYPPQPGDGDSPSYAATRTRLAAQQLVNEIEFTKLP